MTGFDVVMLSYDEPLADQLHARLQRIIGLSVKRLHGVRGMRRAYRLAADVVDTEQFLLADADLALDTQFAVNAIERLAEGVAMRVWRAVNPLNGLVYGYGGLKLIRRSALRRLGEAIDILAALPGQIEFTNQVAGITMINQSPYHAWKAGFRECAMLAHGSEYGMNDVERAERIAAWTAGGQGEFAEFAAAGAREGIALARQATGNPAELRHLNDPRWLLARFTASHGNQALAE